MNALISAHLHRPELQHSELVPMPADSHLAEQDWTR
jgi:hypothetical protein